MKKTTLFLLIALALTITGCLNAGQKTRESVPLKTKTSQDSEGPSPNQSGASDQAQALKIVGEIKALATAGKVQELYDYFYPSFRDDVSFEDFNDFISDPETIANFNALDLNKAAITYWEPYTDGVRFQATDDDIGVDVLLVQTEGGSLAPLQFRIFTLY